MWGILSKHRIKGRKERRMKLTVNTIQDCCESVDIFCSPAEWLILNKALRLLSENEKVHESDRITAKAMYETECIFCEGAERKEE